MNGLSQKQAFGAGLALVLAVNALAIAGVAYNRRGQPESTLSLSEREMREPYDWKGDEENSGIALTLEWRVLVSAEQAAQASQYGYYLSTTRDAEWLNANKLAALGFDVRRPRDTTDSELGNYPYARKEVLLVLEQDGPAYQQSLARVRRAASTAPVMSATAIATAAGVTVASDVDAAKDALRLEEQENSRLFVVDAGVHADVLRAKYPDRAHYAIARGIVRPQWTISKKGSHLSGTISELSVAAINVPKSLRPLFEDKTTRQKPEGRQPTHRFEATISYGNRLEPWLTDAKAR